MIGLDITVKDATEQERKTVVDTMPVGWIESLGTSFDLALELGPYQSLKSAFTRNMSSYENDRIVPMGELNEKYAPIGLKFLEDEKQGYVDLLVERKLSLLKKQDVMSRAPQNFAAQTSYFISGLGGSFVDPINIGTALIPIVGEAKFIQMVGKYGVTRARVAKGAIEGSIGNALFEPMEMSLAKSEQRDYGAFDSLKNIAIGGVLGSGLNVSFGKIGDVYKKYTGKDNIYHDIANAPQEFRDDAVKYSIGQLLQGKRIDIASFIEQTNLERNRELQLQKAAQLQLKGSLNVSADTAIEPTFKTPEGIAELRSLLKDKINLTLDKTQKVQLEKLQEKYSILEKNIQKKKLNIAQEKTSQGKELDIALIEKDKSIIPQIAKLNLLNKQIEKINRYGENNFLRNFIEEQRLTREKGSQVSQETLTKIENLKQVYANAAGLEKTNGEIVSRANKINLNTVGETQNIINDDLASKQNLLRDNRILKQSYTGPGVNKIEVEINSNLIDKIDIDNVNELQSKINLLNEQFSGIEKLARDKSSAFSKYLDDFNMEIKNIDDSLNKQDVLVKGVKAGYSCLNRKGF
jgi:hypothetical protein